LTKEKLKFNDDMRQHVPPQQLWTEFMGDLKFEYDHAEYWPALNKLCDEKFAERKERWVKGGKQYGESEVYLKGGNAPSVGNSVPVSEEKATAIPEMPEKKLETDNVVPAAEVPETETV
jgi:hypothetical protein